MGVTSASPENLAKFATGTTAGRESVVGTTSSVYSLEGQVLAGCGGYGVASSMIGSLWTLWSSMQENERFVKAIHDTLVTADVSGSPSVTVDNSVVTKALTSSGLATPPVPITVQPSQLYGVPETSGFVDDPVCAANGNFVHGETDLTFPGRAGSLNVLRMYNSLATDAIGGFGPGWTSIVDARLSFPVFGEIRAHLVDGAVVSFRPTGTGRWVATGRRSMHIVVAGADADSGALAGWTLVESPTTSWCFDANGVLTRGSTGGGNVVLTRNDAGRVARVSESVSGRSVEYRWVDDRIAEVLASDGRRVAYWYSGDGVLTAVAGPGGTVTYAVDGPLLISATDADDVTLFTNVFDPDGRVMRQTSAFGRVTDYVYEGPTTVITDQHGVRNAMVHDRDGNLTAMVDGDGSTMRMIYDSSARMTRVTDRMGNVWRYEYDQITGDLLRRTDPDGLSASWIWDDAKRLLAEIDRAGNETSYEYMGDLRTPVTVVGADGARATCVVDEFGQPVSVTDPDGVTVRFVWDADGQLQQMVSAVGEPVQFEFDAAGFVVRMVDAGGVATVVERDPASRVLRTVQPEAVTSYHYTRAGRIDAGVEPGDVAWTATFGSHGTVESITDGLGSTVAFGYDVCGNLTQVTAPDDAVFTSDFDPLGRLTSMTLPSGAVTRKRYDLNGECVALTDAAGRRWSRQVDAFGRTVSSVAPDGAVTAWTFHPNHEIATVTGPDGRVWHSGVDVNGRETFVIDPAGRRVEKRYSPAGRLVERISVSGLSERYEYDNAGRCSAVIGIDGVRIDVTVDARGRILRLEADETFVAYDRDTNGAVTRISTADAFTAISHDGGGRVTSVLDATGVARSFRWGERGLLDSSTDGTGARTSYGYDARGRRAIETTPGGAAGRYRFDLDGRLESFEDPAGGTTSMLRDAAGTLTGVRAADGSGWDAVLDGSGREVSRIGTDGSLLGAFGYDLAGRLTSAGSGGLTLGFMWNDSDQLIATTSPYGTRSVERNADGSIAATVDERGRRVEFRRDDRGRVRVVFDSEFGEIDAPDDVVPRRDAGGRLLVSERGEAYRYDSAGRLNEIIPVGAPVTSFTYDDDGLLASESTGSQRRRFQYDSAGRLVLVDDDGAGVTEFGYDMAGRRDLEVRPDGTRVTYRWDVAGRLASIELARGVDLSTVELGYDGLGRLAMVGGTPIGYDPRTGLADQIGDQRVVHLGTRTYTAGGWDTQASVDAGAGVSASLGTVGLYDGPAYGVGVGHVRILGARVFDPTTRQFLSPDPMAPAPGSNGAASGYTYAWHDPVNFVDPSGLHPLTDAEFAKVRTSEGRSAFGAAWQAIKDDPWGTLLMVGVVVVGVALVVATGGAAAAVGIGILVGAGASAGIGVATRTFSPTGVAINGVIGGLSAGAASGATSALSSLATTIPRTVAVGAVVGGATDAGGSVVQQMVTGDHHIDWSTVATQGVIGGVTGGAIAGGSAAWSRMTTPPPVEGPVAGPGAVTPVETPTAGVEPQSTPGVRGRRGNPVTEAHLDQVRDDFLTANPNYVHVAGGRDAVTGARLPEEYIPSMSGGRTGASYPDLTFHGPNDAVVRINTADVRADGSLTSRELANFNRIFEQRPGDTIFAIPKPK